MGTEQDPALQRDLDNVQQSTRGLSPQAPLQPRGAPPAMQKCPCTASPLSIHSRTRRAHPNTQMQHLGPGHGSLDTGQSTTQPEPECRSPLPLQERTAATQMHTQPASPACWGLRKPSIQLYSQKAAQERRAGKRQAAATKGSSHGWKGLL